MSAAARLPYELCELILSSCDSIDDAARLASALPNCRRVWTDLSSRRFICWNIAIRDQPCLIQFEQLVEARFAASCAAPMRSALDEATHRAREFERCAALASAAVGMFEQIRLRCLDSYPQGPRIPAPLDTYARLRFLSTYIHQWTLATLDPFSRYTYMRSLPEDELMRMEDLVYYLSALSPRDRAQLEHNIPAWVDAHGTLQSRPKSQAARFAALTSHWIFLQSQRRQMAAFQALIEERYDMEGGERRCINLAAATPVAV